MKKILASLMLLLSCSAFAAEETPFYCVGSVGVGGEGIQVSFASPVEKGAKYLTSKFQYDENTMVEVTIEFNGAEYLPAKIIVTENGKKTVYSALCKTLK